MDLYHFLIQVYDKFIGLFPPELQWVVTLLILLGVIGAFVAMVRHNILLIIIVIILLPFLCRWLPIFSTIYISLYFFCFIPLPDLGRPISSH
jgi:hypothetical protein